MFAKLRKILLSVPMAVAAGLFALYLLIGYFALPAALKWQAEKQVKDKLDHILAIEDVRFNPLAFELEVRGLALSDAKGQSMLGLRQLVVNFEPWQSVMDRAWTFDAATLEAPRLHVEIAKDGQHNFSQLMARLDELKDTSTKDSALPRFVVKHIVLTGGDIDVADKLLAEPLLTRIMPLAIEVKDLSSVAESPASYSLTAATAAGETVEAHGELTVNGLAAKGQLALKDIKVVTLARALSRFVSIDAPAGQITVATGFDVSITSSTQGTGAPQAGTPAGLKLSLDKSMLSLAGIQVEQRGSVLALAQMQIKAAQLLVVQTGGRLQLTGREASVSVSGLAARQGADRLALGKGGLNVSAISAGTSGSVNGLEARIDDAALRLASLGITALGATSELGQMDSLNLSAKSLALNLPVGKALDLTGDGLGAELSTALLRSPRDGAEVLRLGRATLTGGALRLQDRQFSANTLTLAQGEVKTWLDAQGQFNLLNLFNGTRAPEQPPTDRTEVPAATQTPWRIALQQTEVDALALGFEDRRESPAFALRLEPVRARVSGFDTASTTPMQVDVQSSLASGGDIRVAGNVNPKNGDSDLTLNLAAIALSPAQGYLSKFVDLRLTSGTASSKGRLSYVNGGSPARLTYQGSVAVDSLRLEELASKRPFLSWNTVASDDVLLTMTPNRLDVGEVRVVKPSGRLIIAPDQSVNVMGILKKRASSATPTGATPSDATPKAEPVAPPFPVSIARVRVADGVLEFADLSLRPQFGTRMHELKGVITGLGTDANRNTQLQLNARVDEYGSAKIDGQINLANPKRLTEIDMAFRNLELTSLSPYITKFAGYRIVGGQLALDLRYKVKDSKLLGENKIVLHQVELGEKVDSPNALDLPLELAIAILKDSNDVIDIGLPVSGDLDSPQFDYGAVIVKAIGNLIGSIITAPFRALAALFGSEDQALGTIAFEPGNDALDPPERQKLAAVARALKERPGLSLEIPPTYATEQDTPVLQSRAVRSEIVKAMGITLALGEDPGPIDVANARTQRAIEGALSTRYAPEVLAALKRRATEATGSAKEGPQSEFYQGLVDRMISEQPISSELLTQLATRRGEAVLRELTGVGSVAAERSTLGKPQPSNDADNKTVTMRLELKVAK